MLAVDILAVDAESVRVYVPVSLMLAVVLTSTMEGATLPETRERC